MTLNVWELARGGYGAHGGAHFDPRLRRIMLDVLEDEVVDVVIQFENAPTAYDYWEDGIDGSEPSISGNTIVVQFQELNPSGTYEILVTFNSGAQKRVVFQANQAQIATGNMTAPDDDDDMDGGVYG